MILRSQSWGPSASLGEGPEPGQERGALQQTPASGRLRGPDQPLLKRPTATWPETSNPAATEPGRRRLELTTATILGKLDSKEQLAGNPGAAGSSLGPLLLVANDAGCSRLAAGQDMLCEADRVAAA